MLGEKLGQETGRVTSRRVVSTDIPPSLEISMEAKGELLGVEHQTIATYVSEIRTNGTVYGHGEGVVTGKHGELATWKGSGVRTISEDGGAKFRGAIYYETASPAWVSLNAVAAVFEYSENADGSTSTEIWEWR